jgi:flagellar biosynthesis/type III secretory pathway ATPase
LKEYYKKLLVEIGELRAKLDTATDKQVEVHDEIYKRLSQSGKSSEKGED